MKKVLRFIRSMKFGLILLLAVAAFSVVGSLIPQTFEADWYLENYPTMGEIILALGIERIFATWYFITLCVMLGLSLISATVTRFLSLRKILINSLNVPQNGYRPEEPEKLDEEKFALLRTYLQKKRYRELNTGEATVYYKNRIGYFGSALVHLSLLLVLIFGGAVLTLNYYNDVFLIPGETVQLSDGSHLHLYSFTRLDEVTGRTESISVLEVTAPNGQSSGVREIRVNRPLRFNSYRFYQFHHMYAGSITATDLETGASETFMMIEPSLLTTDGVTGIWYDRIFQDWRIDEETGGIVVIFYDAAYFPNPLYRVMVSEDGSQTERFAIPGSHIHVDGIRYEFNDLVNYPGIRVSYSPHPFPTLLAISAVILLVGLFLAFYLNPSVVVLKDGRYALTTAKSSGIDLEIKAMLKDDSEVATKKADVAKAGENAEKQKTEREVDI